MDDIKNTLSKLDALSEKKDTAVLNEGAFGKALGTAAGFLPVVGSAMSFKDAYDSYKAGDKTGAALNAVIGAAGLVPGGSIPAKIARGIGTGAVVGSEAAAIKRGEYDELPDIAKGWYNYGVDTVKDLYDKGTQGVKNIYNKGNQNVKNLSQPGKNTVQLNKGTQDYTSDVRETKMNSVEQMTNLKNKMNEFSMSREEQTNEGKKSKYIGRIPRAPTKATPPPLVSTIPDDIASTASGTSTKIGPSGSNVSGSATTASKTDTPVRIEPPLLDPLPPISAPGTAPKAAASKVSKIEPPTAAAPEISVTPQTDFATTLAQTRAARQAEAAKKAQAELAAARRPETTTKIPAEQPDFAKQAAEIRAAKQAEAAKKAQAELKASPPVSTPNPTKVPTLTDIVTPGTTSSGSYSSVPKSGDSIKDWLDMLNKQQGSTQSLPAIGKNQPMEGNFPGYWRGTDSAKAARSKMVGSIEESVEHRAAMLMAKYKNFKSGN